MNQHSLLACPSPVPTCVNFAIPMDVFQEGFRQLASGVSIVTTRHDGEDLGIAATSVSSLSADPPSLLVCINQNSGVHDRLLETGRFCVNVLAEEHEEISQCFGNPALKNQRFANGDWVDRDLPVLKDALASFECSVVASHAFGTHTIVVGQINRIETRARDRDPLLYFRGQYK